MFREIYEYSWFVSSLSALSTLRDRRTSSSVVGEKLLINATKYNQLTTLSLCLSSTKRWCFSQYNHEHYACRNAISSHFQNTDDVFFSDRFIVELDRPVGLWMFLQKNADYRHVVVDNGRCVHGISLDKTPISDLFELW